jgi:hypothetical protein
MKKIFFVVFAAGLALSLAGCGTTENAVREMSNGEPDLPDQKTAAPSLEEVYDSGYWVTRPLDGTITVLGIAGRRSNREEAVTEALSDAARKVALYHGVSGESASVLNQGSGNLDYFSDFDYRLDLLHRYEDYIGDLVFDKDRDILEKDGSVFVRAQYQGVSGIPVYETVMEDGVPVWVRNHAAAIPGFLTAVGFSKNRGSLQKTYQASYEDAIVSLLPGLSSKVANEIIDVAGDRITQSVSTNSGVLENVMILEVWLDRRTNTVWTLLIAKESV